MKVWVWVRSVGGPENGHLSIFFCSHGVTAASQRGQADRSGICESFKKKKPAAEKNKETRKCESLQNTPGQPAAKARKVLTQGACKNDRQQASGVASKR